MKKMILPTLLLLLQCSCCDTIQKTLEGNWGVKEIYFQDQPYGISLLSNIITFKQNGECGFPITDPGQENKGEWLILQHEGALNLILDIPGNPFNGEYNLIFEKDYHEKLLILILQNEEMRIKAAKFMYDFDKENGTVIYP